nr:septum formation inhibitor Maf [uncultured Allomuricauda sp.]
MKTSVLTFSTSFLLILLIVGCKKENNTNASSDAATSTKMKEQPPRNPLSEDFKGYWYAGKAEITSYELSQARYGEIRKGKSVLIYVTEPFLPKEQVKANNSNLENVSVLKLNATKKFLTGIYPYSIMSSTFYPVYDNQHAIKTSLSVQEWCGHVYSQLNNREKFEFTSHSYFEGEADQAFNLEKSVMENEIWTKIRINPDNLPIGETSIIPSLEFLRLSHQEVKPYNANTQLSSQDGITTYTISYPELERTLKINFTNNFPYHIESWTEEFKSGFGPNAKKLMTSATKIKSLKTAYWQQNENKNVILRDSLGL